MDEYVQEQVRGLTQERTEESKDRRRAKKEKNFVAIVRWVWRAAEFRDTPVLAHTSIIDLCLIGLPSFATNGNSLPSFAVCDPSAEMQFWTGPAQFWIIQLTTFRFKKKKKKKKNANLDSACPILDHSIYYFRWKKKKKREEAAYSAFYSFLSSKTKGDNSHWSKHT